ncbi:MAG: hypothetical protein K1Y36_07365 [Blastocatellia bacterium]|nr:hypothetical protein [Blastocatellia bacterium]
MSWTPVNPYLTALDPHRDFRIPDQLRSAVAREMRPGEQLLWVGNAAPLAHLLPTIPLVLFGIPWTGFALFWTAGAAGFRIPDLSRGWVHLLFPLWGIPFILIGLGMLTSPLWAWRKALKTLYAVTSQRIIIFEKGWQLNVTSYTREQIVGLSRSEKEDGSGNLYFAEKDDRPTDSSTRKPKVGMYGIKDVLMVENLIRDHILASKQ